MSERLKQFIKQNNIVQHGEFKLASGKTTDTYFDCRSILLDTEGLECSVPPLFHSISHIKFDAVGGIGVGGSLLVGAMLMHHRLKGFIVRKEPKKHGTQKFIEGSVKPGMKVALLEDVCTSGKSIHFAYECAKDFGLEPVVIGCILNRQEGADELFQSLGIPFVYLLEKNQLK